MFSYLKMETDIFFKFLLSILFYDFIINILNLFNTFIVFRFIKLSDN